MHHALRSLVIRGQLHGATQNRKMAVDFARNVLPVVEKLRSAGTTSLEGIARALNERGVRTARGGA